jgi:DNA-binding response OmpR family regulator
MHSNGAQLVSLAGDRSFMLANCYSPSILVVEDDRHLAHVLCRVLSRFGYAVDLAPNVASALCQRERAPALALLDLHLLDGNGVDLAGELRVRYPDLPMLLMTACPFRLQDRPDGARYFRQVLPKPLDLPLLRRAIFAALNEGNHANEIAACSC